MHNLLNLSVSTCSLKEYLSPVWRLAGQIIDKLAVCGDFNGALRLFLGFVVTAYINQNNSQYLSAPNISGQHMKNVKKFKKMNSSHKVQFFNVLLNIVG